ncbi:MAG TPA: sensor histidine kinase [Devosiaceae bacterium]
MQLQPASGINTPISLSGNLSILRDPGGALTLDDILSGHPDTQFEPIPSMLTAGYLKGAVWIRFSLSNPTGATQWLLQVERPLIEEVTLYVPDGAGHFTIAAPGLRSAGQNQGAGAYPNIFPIFVPERDAQYYVRFESTTSMTTVLNIWQTDGYLTYRYSDHWIIGTVIGAIAVMIMANLLYAALLKDSFYLLYAAVLFVSGLLTVFHLGYANELFWPLDPTLVHRGWGAIACLHSVVMIWFMGRLFEFRRHWIWGWRINQGIVLLNGIAAILSIAGRYGDVGLFVSRLQQVSYLFIAVFVLYLLIVRRQGQYLLSALAFVGVVAVSIVMQSQYTGTNLLGIDSSLGRFMAVGTLIHLVLLSAAIALRARRAEVSLGDEKDRVIALSRSAEQELTIKVRERTAELAESNASLQAEVNRRQVLEMKLRQSLDSVNDALAQQRDFVALVSHEFRAPLAVIAAAADNLSSAPESPDTTKARSVKIRQTVSRLSMLIENVLAGDRLDADEAQSQTMETFDLNEILHINQMGLDDGSGRRVKFIQGEEAYVKGDRTLLEIVVQNLIQNALKYSDATSSVTVRLLSGQGTVAVDVTDEGAGVAPHDHELIFLKYYRSAGQRVSGSGLGLYISREVARQHGGDLYLAASSATGSTFRLSLPSEARAARARQSGA